MRIAIPVYGIRISPRFDIARRLLLIDLENGRVAAKKEISFDILPPLRRILFLRDQGVQILLCGGIRRCDYFALEEMRITVHASLIGEVDDILISFISGKLRPGYGMMPGPAGMRMRRGWHYGNRYPGPKRRGRR